MNMFITGAAGRDGAPCLLTMHGESKWIRILLR
jgi:hypothetical protein